VETNHNFLQTGGQPDSDRMRELLARAAQDNVYEQRSQGQVLDEIRQRLEGMEWLLREVRERELSGLTGQLDSVRGQVDELSAKPPEWAEGFAEHIEAVGERVKPVAELPALWADVGVVAENVDEGLSWLQSVIDSAQHLVDATQQATQHMEDMGKRLDKLQGSMEAASVRFNRLDKSLAELGHRTEKLEHSITGVATRVDQSLSEMGERIEQGIDAVSGRVEGVSGRLDGVDRSLDGIDGRLEGLSGRFDGLDGKLEGVTGRLDSVSQRIGQLPAALEIGELHRKLTELVKRPYADHSDRFDALEKRLAEAVDPLIDELRARPDRDEVKDMMSKIAVGTYGDVTRRMDEFSRRFESVHEDVTKRVEGVHEEFAKRNDSMQDEVSRRLDGVQDQVGRKVDSVHDEVSKRMAAVHEDVLKRLTTLEETMLALAEALLRPRREGKE
jgi:chromosome segregation ATPase